MSTIPGEPASNPASPEPIELEAFMHCAYPMAVGDVATARVRSCNAAFARLLGRSIGETVGLPISEIYAPEARAAAHARIADSDRTGAATYESALMRKDGAAFPVEISLVTVCGASGAPAFRVASIKDLTALNRAESARRASESRLAAIFRSSPAAICLCEEAGGRIADVNEAFVTLTGHARASAIGRPLAGLGFLTPSAERDELLAAIGSSWAVKNLELAYTTPGGAEGYVQASLETLEREPGSLRVLVLNDITPRKRLENALHIRRNLAAGLAGAYSISEGALLCLDAAMASVGFDAGGFYLRDEATGELELIAHRGVASNFVAVVRHFSADTPQAQLVAARQPHYFEGEEIGPTRMSDEHKEGLRCLAAVPVHFDGRAIGSLNVGSRTRSGLGPEERGLLETIGTDAALAIARLHAETKARESAGQLQLLLTAGQFATFHLDLIRDRLTWDTRCLELFGYQPGEFDGTNRSFRDRVHPDDLPGIDALWRRCSATREPFAHEFRLRLPDGTIRWIASYGRVEFDETGHAVRLHGVARDASARREMESRLRARDELFASVIEQSADSVAIIDAQDGHMVEFNGVAHRTLGYSRAEFARLTVRDFQAAHSPEEIRDNITAAHREGGVTFETTHRDRHGNLRDVRVSLRSLSHQSHEYLVAVWTDITEQRKSELALRASEQSYREIFDAAADAIYVHEIDTGRVIDVNQGTLRLFGYTSKAEFINTGLPAVFVDDPRYDLNQARRWLRRAAEEGPQLFEWRTRRKDGAEFWVEVSLRTAQIGGAPRVLAVVRNIDARKEAERALTLSQNRLHLAAEVAQIGTWDRDMRTGVLTWSPDQEKLMGLEPGTFSGTDEALAALIHPDSLATHEEARQRARCGDGLYQAELCFRLPNGKERWGLIRGRTEFDRDGRPERIIGVDIDITAQKLAEAVHRRQSALLSSLLDSIPDLIFYKDTAGVYLGCNPAFTAFVGRPAGEIIGKTDFDLFPKDEANFFRGQDRLMLEQLEVRRNEEWVTYPDGRRVLLDTLKTPYRAPDGRLMGVLGVSRDITDRRRTENVQASRIRLLEFAATHTLDELLVATLDEAELLTGSKVGFYHFLEPDQATISLQAWSTRTSREMCKAEGKGRHYDVHHAGVWVDCIRERRPVIHNDYASLPHRRGLPEGHAPVLRELVVPIFRGNLIVALLGVGNKPTPYETADIDQVFKLADLAWDIAERKRAEARRHESESRYRNLVEASSDWIWEVDTAGRYTYASPRVRELLGYEPEAVLGRTPFDFMPPAEAHRLRDQFAEIAAARRPFISLENVNVHRDGRRVVIETNGVPSFAPDGTWIGYHGMDRDITARREAERMLRLHGTALETAANAIVILDDAGHIEWANPAFTTLSGWTLAEARGQSPRRLLDSGQHDEAFYESMGQTMRAGRVWQGEIINRRKDGTLRTEEMSITPLADAGGTITHFIAIKQDITERKLLEAQNRAAQRMEAIGTLAGGIAHDLNNILAPILIVSGLLKERTDDESNQEMFAMLEQSARRGSDIIRQLLTFSRGAEGERIPVQARHLVKEMASIIRETFPREIDFRLNAAADLPTVVADPTQLHQVLLNLCVNARDAMPDGGHLTLRAATQTFAPQSQELPPDHPAGTYLLIEVADTGHGIPPEIVHRIFDPFFTTKPIGKGTGLGLSTVQGIVRSHKGFILVDSKVGAGTTFRVFIPAEKSAATEPPASARSADAGRGECILVVDDERNVRESTRLLLESRGYHVRVAVSGKDALNILGQHRPEIRLIITDLMMPEMNGLAMLKALRATDPALPVIAVSGLGEIDHAAELARLGVVTTLAKPCTPDIMLHAVERALHAARSAPA